MRRSSWGVVFVLLAAACNVKSSFSGGGSTTPGGTSTASSPPSPSSSSSSSSSPSSSPSSSSSGDPNERIPMIDLTGKTPAQATVALRAAGFNGELVVNRTALECVDAQQVPGQINCQNPEPGKLYYKRHEINVHVYEVPTHAGRITTTQLDKAIGMSIEEAKKYLKRIGHTGELVIKEAPYFHEGCAKNHICSYGPAGISTNDRLTLQINKNNTEITMPD